MMLELFLVFVWVAFAIKNFMTFFARMECALEDMQAHDDGPSYAAMLLHPFRWTFAQHYPELAKRVQP